MKEFNLNGLKLHFVSNTTQLVHVTALTYQTVSEHMFVGVYVYMHAWCVWARQVMTIKYVEAMILINAWGERA